MINLSIQSLSLDNHLFIYLWCYRVNQNDCTSQLDCIHRRGSFIPLIYNNSTRKVSKAIHCDIDMWLVTQWLKVSENVGTRGSSFQRISNLYRLCLPCTSAVIEMVLLQRSPHVQNIWCYLFCVLQTWSTAPMSWTSASPTWQTHCWSAQPATAG